MIWFLSFAGGLAALILILTVVGLRVPREHQAAVSARFSKPAADLWRLLSSADERVKWRCDVKRIEPAPDQNGHPVFVEILTGGRMPLEVVESIPAQRLVLRIADPKAPFGGVWIHELSADGAGTVLTITEDGFVTNPILRALARFVFGHHMTLEKVMKQLGRHCGEQILPRRVTYLTSARRST